MIEINKVSKSFGSISVLNKVTFKIEDGDIFGIIGHSGAGKSTLLRCLNGLESYDEGSIKIGEKEIKELNNAELRRLRKDLGMIFQNFNLMSRKDVYENIGFPLQIWGEDKKKIKIRVNELLELVGLTDKIHTRANELSGGQKQRVGIARALALNPKILICDEATSALDPKTTKSILNLLMDINKKLKITIVLVTHQMEVIKEVCNTIVILEGGEVKTKGYAHDLFLKPTVELKNLMGEEEVLPSFGHNIKIFFPKEISQNCLITSIARNLDVDFSIVWGKLEKFRGEVLGSLIINVSDDSFEVITGYLDEKSVGWEVVKHVN